MADKYLNQTGLNYYHNRIKTIFADKTAFDTLSDKVDEIIAEGGEPNVIETVKVNNVALVPVEKAVNIDLSTYALKTELPTKTSDLTNDSDFQTETEVQTAIDNALADITSFEFEVVQSLPQTGEKGVIYLVANSGSGQNVYDEYIWIDGNPGSYEKIGSTDVDLSNYWTSTSGESNSLIAITTAEIDTLFS